MVLFNYSTKEITAKIVYYGPGLCGKTTNLQFVYENLPQTINKGKMLSLATKTDRTLFFDFLPIDLGTIRGMRTRLQLYTVPGQVFYNTTRKLVLKGADGVVFVADSQRRMIEANVESFKNLEENLAEHDMKLAEMPIIVQFNKRDLPDVAGIEELNAAINRFNAPIYEAVATTGIGVHETLKAITRLVLNALKERYVEKSSHRPSAGAAAVAAQAAQNMAQAANVTKQTAAAAPATPRPAPMHTAPAAPPMATIGRVEAFGEETADLVELDPLEAIEESGDPGAVPHAAPPAALDDALELDLVEESGDALLEEPILDLEMEPEIAAAPSGRFAAAAPAAAEAFDLGSDDEVQVIDADAEEGIPDPLADSLDLGAGMSADEPEAASFEADPLFPDALDGDDLMGTQAPPAAAPPSFAPPPPSRAAAAEPAPAAASWDDAPSSSFDSDTAIEIDGDAIAPMPPPRTPAPRPAAAVQHVPASAALPGGIQEIALPVRLEIAGQMIELELKISLDLIGRAAQATVVQPRRESA